MKRLYKIFAAWFLCLFLVLSQFIVSLADVKSLMIRTDSNALMTLDLADNDYLIQPRSSIVSINNTVDYSGVYLYQRLIDTESGMYRYDGAIRVNSDGSYRYYVPSGYALDRFGFILKKNALPSSGVYRFRLDNASDVSIDYVSFNVNTFKEYSNATTLNSLKSVTNYTQQVSGEFFTDFIFDVGSFSRLEYFATLEHTLASGSLVAGVVKVNFSLSDEEPDISSVGIGEGTQDYENNVSSSLSDLSSSVDIMTDEISGVTEAIQNLQGAMEPHYSNVLTQLHHITEQLHAFYDQVYNNIHLPELSMLTQIKEAIENIDLQIEVDISEVKTAINNMSTAVQNKLQSTTDQITGGYDNSGMSSDKSELDGVLDQYEQAEEQLFDNAQGHINDFEFNTPLDSFTGPLSDVSYFLNGMFEAMGPMNVVISFSLTLTIAMVMIGWYRFKGGR